MSKEQYDNMTLLELKEIAKELGIKNISKFKKSQLIEEIKFVLLGTRMLMVVIVTDSGLVKETIIKYDEDITLDKILLKEVL